MRKVLQNYYILCIFLLKQICHLSRNTFCSPFISEMFKEFCAMVCYNIIRSVVDQKKILIKCFKNCAAWLVWVKIFSDWNDKPHYCYHDNKNASIKTRLLIWLLRWEAWDPCAHVAAWMTEGISKLLFTILVNILAHFYKHWGKQHNSETYNTLMVLLLTLNLKKSYLMI